MSCPGGENLTKTPGLVQASARTWGCEGPRSPGAEARLCQPATAHSNNHPLNLKHKSEQRRAKNESPNNVHIQVMQQGVTVQNQTAQSLETDWKLSQTKAATCDDSC